MSNPEIQKKSTTFIKFGCDFHNADHIKSISVIDDSCNVIFTGPNEYGRRNQYYSGKDLDKCHDFTLEYMNIATLKKTQ